MRGGHLRSPTRGRRRCATARKPTALRSTATASTTGYGAPATASARSAVTQTNSWRLRVVVAAFRGREGGAEGEVIGLAEGNQRQNRRDSQADPSRVQGQRVGFPGVLPQLINFTTAKISNHSRPSFSSSRPKHSSSSLSALKNSLSRLSFLSGRPRLAISAVCDRL